jgi:predicted ribosomally synthesized peptide with nif11-like leader
MGNILDFYNAITKDEALRTKTNALGAKYRGKQPTEAEVTADFIAFAKAEGYEFNAEEYKAFAGNPRKISDDDLKAVAGGSFEGGSCYCIIGGGGKDKVTGKVCACVAIGVSMTENKDELSCFALGFVNNK